MPWIFAKDYQHTGINRKLKAEHADRIIHIMDGNILTDEKNRTKRVAHHETPVS